MEKLRALIVDDEVHARENLLMMLNEFCPEIDVVGQAGNVNQALSAIEQLSPEVVFLDIRMPSGSEGFDLLDKTTDLNFQVVFVTAFKDFAVRAFNANAVHYILKPIDIDDLLQAVQKLLNYRATLSASAQNKVDYISSLKELSKNMRGNTYPEKLTLYHAKGFRIVNTADIVRLEGQGSYTEITFKDGTQYMDSKNLKVFEELLNPSVFFRVHKSHIINLLELREYIHTDGGEAIMSNHTHVPIARTRLTDFLDAVKRL